MLPKVVIVGRPNVGKSSLLNMLAGRMISIVDPTAGVTRDRISTVIEVPPKVRPPRGEPAVTHKAELIDTGGYGIEDLGGDELAAEVERQIAIGLGEAEVILFVIDAQQGITPLDREVAQMLRTAAKGDAADDLNRRVVLVANKVDSPSLESLIWEASRLGFGEPIPVSATTNLNKLGLLEAITERIDFSKFTDTQEEQETGPLLAIVGKRNAGKSTLVNALAGGERVIVSPIEGTTRDSVDVRFEIDGKVFTAIDTAGVRKRKSLAGDIEFYSYHRSLRSLRRADVVLLLLDATVAVSQVDEQLSTEIQRHHKPVVIVVNKWDLVEDRTTEEQYMEYLEKALQGLNYAPVALISAAQGEGMRELVAMALNLHEQASHRVSTSELNRAIEQIIAEHPPASKQGRRLKIYYVSQVGVRPPTIALFVNDPLRFDPTYQRYLLNKMRDVLPFSEVPIKLVVRGRRPAGDEEKG